MSQQARHQNVVMWHSKRRILSGEQSIELSGTVATRLVSLCELVDVEKLPKSS